MSPSAVPSGPVEIQGPSALGGGGPRLRHLLWLSAAANFKHRFAGSTLGYAWALISPLALFAVLYVVVTQILARGNTTPDYPVLLLFNIELFQFFGEATIYSTQSLVRGSLVRKMTIPQAVPPLAAVLTMILVYAPGVLLALVVILAYGVSPTLTWLLLPLVLAALITLVAFLALLLSTLFVRFRDVGLIWPLIARVLFYLTPVLFPIEAIPKGLFTTLESFNPLAPLFVQARVWVIDPDAPTWFEWANGTFQAVMPFVVFAATCALGCVVFARRAGRAAEQV